MALHIAQTRGGVIDRPRGPSDPEAPVLLTTDIEKPPLPSLVVGRGTPDAKARSGRQKVAPQALAKTVTREKEIEGRGDAGIMTFP